MLKKHANCLKGCLHVADRGCTAINAKADSLLILCSGSRQPLYATGVSYSDALHSETKMCLYPDVLSET